MHTVDDRRQGTVAGLLKLFRIKHYVKNLLILLPLFFSGKIAETPRLVNGLIAFACFCLIASVVYVFNDLRDIEKDRAHPTKKNRPLASGAVSPLAAKLSMTVMGIIAALVCIFLLPDPANLWTLGLLALYLVINIAYSMGLKNVPIVDLGVLVAGFLIRVLTGATATDIVPSHWFYLTIMAVCFFLALGKRRNELRIGKDGQTRKVLKRYNWAFLDKNMYLSLGLAIAFYSLWAVDPQTIATLGTDNQVWTVPLVIMTTMRYSMNVESTSDGDPVEVLFSDKVLLLLGAVTGIALMGIIYFG